MSHTKYTWTSGSTITAPRMNNIEAQYTHYMTDYGSHTHDTRYYTKTLMDSTFWNVGNQGPDSGADADYLKDAESNLHHGADLSAAAVPSGIIIMYYGDSAPSGWYICNGSNGTPNLANKYLVGAGNLYTRMSSYGNNTVSPTTSCSVSATTLTAAESAHTHTYADKYLISPGYYSGVYEGSGGANDDHTMTLTSTSQGGGGSHTHTHSVSTDSADMRPPSIALTYIKKS